MRDLEHASSKFVGEGALFDEAGNGIEKLVDALLLQGRSEEHGKDGSFGDKALHCSHGDRAVLEELLDCLLVRCGACFRQFRGKARFRCSMGEAREDHAHG